MFKKFSMRVLSILLVTMLVLGLSISCKKAKDDTGSSTSSKTNKAKNPEDYKATLTSWGWDDTYWKTMTKAFNKKYPNIKFEYTPMANGESLQKYQTALASGAALPDIAWAIIDSRGKLFELNMWEALNKAPYNFDKSKVFDYLDPILVNSKGDVCGIEQSICPAGMAYRRDLAKEYLGTDDPEKIAELLPDWDTFIAKGKEIKEKSDGKVFMIPSISDIQQIIRDQDATKWFDGDTVQVTKALKRTIDLLAKFRDAGIVDKLDAWSPAWYASYGQGKHIFAGCATWTSQFVIQPNDKDGKDKGHWGLTNIPEGNISWGGTTLGIAKTCKNKDAAWEFVKFATMSKEGADVLKSIGMFTTVKSMYDDKEFASFKDPWFGGQDTGKYFLEKIVPKIKLKPMSKDNNVIHDALNLVTTSLNNDKKMTASDALDKLKSEIKSKLPNMKIK